MPTQNPHAIHPVKRMQHGRFKAPSNSNSITQLATDVVRVHAIHQVCWKEMKKRMGRRVEKGEMMGQKCWVTDDGSEVLGDSWDKEVPSSILIRIGGF